MSEKKDAVWLHDYFRQHEEVVKATAEKLQGPVLAVGEALIGALKDGHKLIAFGNGGSAVQASHLVAELVGRFSKAPRKPLPAIALSSDLAVVTCIGNDFGFGSLFERQMEALAEKGDIVFGFTTSGRSENILRGLAMAARKGAVTVAITGADGLVGDTADHVLSVPSRITPFIQEVHLMFLHILCTVVDHAFVER